MKIVNGQLCRLLSELVKMIMNVIELRIAIDTIEKEESKTLY